MLREKLRQIILARVKEHRQIAAVDDVASKRESDSTR